LDFYGLKGTWAGYKDAQGKSSTQEKYTTLTEAVRIKVQNDFSCDTSRFLPNFIMHETEGLYFSSPQQMASELNVLVTEVDQIISECGEPEAINNSPQTAPSKRIATLLGQKEFKLKTTVGINVAKRVTLICMRQNCPLFDQWLSDIEKMCHATT